MAHSPKPGQHGEPWHLVEWNGGFSMQDANNLYPTDSDFPRIVACVNAMRGIQDPEAFMRRIREAIQEGLISISNDLQSYS